MMNQREVQDKKNILWQCVQALEGANSGDEQKIRQRLENEKGQVPVVCTPSGGAQTVRLYLEKNWRESLSDESLLTAIQNAAS